MIAQMVVVLTGVSLVAFALSVAITPRWAERFLSGFASSARAHYTEQVLRIVSGSALIMFAGEMRFARFFGVLGWLLVGTSAVLLLIPWRWHHRFGKWAIPLAIRYLKLYALGAFVLGAFILFAIVSP